MVEREEKKLIKRDEGRKAKRAELEESIITSQKKKEKMEEKIAEKDEAIKQCEVEIKAEEEDAKNIMNKCQIKEAMIKK